MDFDFRLPLQGIRVIDFGQLIAVPCAGMVLAELGAEVIKVERPEGDPGRGLKSAGARDISGIFAAFNRSKRSVALDLKSPDGVDAARRLIGSADVVLQGFRPGTMDRLGLGAEASFATNEHLIYASLSAFGDDAANADRGGVDLIIQAESGMMSLTGLPNGEPTRIGFTVIDVAAANVLAQAVVASLFGRERSGRGCVVNVALIDVALHLQSGNLTEFMMTSIPPVRSGNRVPYASPAGIFRTSDGYIALSGYQPAQWAALCEIMGAPTLRDDPRFADSYSRVVHNDELWVAIETILTTATTDEWLRRCHEAGVPAGRVQDHRAVTADPQLISRGTIALPVGDAPAFVALPARFGHASPVVGGSVPTLGEHTQEVLEELGIATADRARQAQQPIA